MVKTMVSSRFPLDQASDLLVTTAWGMSQISKAMGVGSSGSSQAAQQLARPPWRSPKLQRRYIPLTRHLGGNNSSTIPWSPGFFKVPNLSMAMTQEPIHWRYHIFLAYYMISMVQYLHFRIPKFPLNLVSTHRRDQPEKTARAWKKRLRLIEVKSSNEHVHDLRWFSHDLMVNIPSGKRLHSELERSTMLFSWENPRFRLGHCQ